MARGNKLALEDLPSDMKHASAPGAGGAPGAETSWPGIGGRITLDQLEEMHLRGVLANTKSLTEAADVLGIDQATLYRKRKKIGLE